MPYVNVKCVIFSSLNLFPCFRLFRSFSVYNILCSKWVRLREETKEFFERPISSTSCKDEKLGRIIVSRMSSLFRICYSFSSTIRCLSDKKISDFFLVSFVSLLTIQWILYCFMQWWNFYYHVILYLIQLNQPGQTVCYTLKESVCCAVKNFVFNSTHSTCPKQSFKLLQ